MAGPPHCATGAETLDALRLPSDRLSVSPQGMLQIDGVGADALLDRFGSPLNVIVAPTLRANYRRIRDVFAAAWPAPVRVLYAIKANDTLAIRAILSEEGAGGDCFSLGELHATLAGGADPGLLVMTGSNKSAAEVEAAVAAGLTLNVDGEHEVALLAKTLRGRAVGVNLRLKVMPEALNAHVSELHPTPGGYTESVRRAKWGTTVGAAAQLVDRLRSLPGVELLGYSCHMGHLSSRPEAFAAVASGIAAAVAELHAATGFVPRVLDIGGGWAQQRDPSFRHAGLTDAPIEAVARATVAALRGALPPGPLPELWIEPGRFIVSNAVVLLARGGAVKRDAGYCWIHIDASANNLARIESGRFHHAILPASRMFDPADEVVEVVGSTCFRSLLGAARALPAPRPGDIVAILDAGMYAEVFATQFNGVPRPAAVLLSAHGAEVVRERETIEDVYRLQRLPAWLARAPA